MLPSVACLTFMISQHAAVCNSADAMVMVKLFVRHHVVHICDGEFSNRICFHPDAAAAGPTEAAEVSVVAKLSREQGTETISVAISAEIVVFKVAKLHFAKLILM